MKKGILILFLFSLAATLPAQKACFRGENGDVLTVYDIKVKT